jgi:hypothetical protein
MSNLGVKLDLVMETEGLILSLHTAGRQLCQKMLTTVYTVWSVRTSSLNPRSPFWSLRSESKLFYSNNRFRRMQTKLNRIDELMRAAKDKDYAD